MTNNSDGWGIRITQPVYMFIVLMAGVVGLLVISTSLTRTDVVRPHPTAVPIDPFANVSYQTYVSPDGTYQADYPAAWSAQEDPTTPLVTNFVPSGSNTQTGLRLFFTALRAMQTLPTDTSPEGFVRQALQIPQGQTTALTPIEVSGGLKGSCGTTETDLNDGSKGKAELCVIALDGDHLLVIQAITRTAQWSRMEAVMERLKSSLQIKVESVVERMSAVLGAQTPATPEATSAATSEPTVEATSAATAAATVEASTAATSEATAVVTVEATQAATADVTPTP